MPSPNRQPTDPTADYRQYPKGPNFGRIVALAAAVLLVLLVVAWFVLHRDASKMIPHGPNPQPNSALHLPSSLPPTPNS